MHARKAVAASKSDWVGDPMSLALQLVTSISWGMRVGNDWIFNLWATRTVGDWGNKFNCLRDSCMPSRSQGSTSFSLTVSFSVRLSRWFFMLGILESAHPFFSCQDGRLCIIDISQYQVPVWNHSIGSSGTCRRPVAIGRNGGQCRETTQSL